MIMERISRNNLYIIIIIIIIIQIFIRDNLQLIKFTIDKISPY